MHHFAWLPRWVALKWAVVGGVCVLPVLMSLQWLLFPVYVVVLIGQGVILLRV